MPKRLQIRNDKASNWEDNNPVLAKGEVGAITDTHKLKVGDGETKFNDISTTALDTEVVHKSGDETINGVKTFQGYSSGTLKAEAKFFEDRFSLEKKISSSFYPYIQWVDGSGDRGGFLGRGKQKEYIEYVGDNANNFVFSGVNVGINTTNPSEKLEVDGSIKVVKGIGAYKSYATEPATGDNNAYIGIMRGNDIEGTTLFDIRSRYKPGELNGESLVFDLRGASKLKNFRFKSDRNGDNWLTINSNGVGIGTDDPGGKLDIRTGNNVYIQGNSDNQRTGLDIRSNSNESGETRGAINAIGADGSGSDLGTFRIYSAYGDMLFKQDTHDNIRFYAKGDDRLIINGNTGNVGIWTNDPDSKLTVAGGDAEVKGSDNGVILEDSDGDRWRVQIGTDGNLTTTKL